MSTVDFAQLVGAAKQGNQDAITDLYNATYRMAYGIARQYIKDEDSALDVLQMAYVKAFENLDKLQKPESFDKWLNRIVMNQSKDFLKKKTAILFSQMEGEEDDPVEFEDERTDEKPDAAMDYQETKRLVRQILDSLSDEQRLVTLMFYFENLSVKEIAAQLSCSENTVKSRLNYARQKIKVEVLQLEKEGTKLYGLAPIPFLFYLLQHGDMALELSAVASQALAGGIKAKLAADAAGTGAAATASTGAAAGTSASAGTSVAAGTASSVTVAGASAGAAGAGAALAIKIVAGVLVAGIITGGGVALANIVQNQSENVSDPVSLPTQLVTSSMFSESIPGGDASNITTSIPLEKQISTEDIVGDLSWAKSSDLGFGHLLFYNFSFLEDGTVHYLISSYAAGYDEMAQGTYTLENNILVLDLKEIFIFGYDEPDKIIEYDEPYHCEIALTKDVLNEKRFSATILTGELPLVGYAGGLTTVPPSHFTDIVLIEDDRLIDLAADHAHKNGFDFSGFTY
ncbi:sigma-70 family RNA polymerase sigma factor [Ruminococcaceae bacterium OttesenSCG-928-A16]|nr:sigma-70 family RNA polymerase sigma factor [Ruminococcaceae bacterium OttesenSCG-928-A16]